MSFILNIDTSLETAFVSIAKNGVPLATRYNAVQKEHAGFVHQAVKELSEQCEIKLKDLSAIAVSEGPGSYTGLRVGMSSAIGLCYALHKPFIKISTLQMIAHDACQQIEDSGSLICPMVDARRMEVFTALYDQALQVILNPVAMVLHQDSFKDFLNNQKIYFSGNGSLKCKDLFVESNAVFLPINDLSLSMSSLAQKAFLHLNFNDFTESEPNYIKEFVNFPSK